MTGNRRRRIHARLRDERGFSLLETVIALTVIFASLVVLAHAGSAAFGYTALARERQAATGIANEVMESVRALAWDRLTAGLSSSDLTGDPLIVDCSGVYKYGDCATGETIVQNPGLTDQCPAPADPCPLVPHRGTVSGTGYPTSYDWAVYVTNDDPAADPYRVTVIVSWDAGRVGAAKSIRSESLFFAPEGCGSVITHPFAGPCQATYTGVAQTSGGTITFSPASGVAGANFTTAQITLAGASTTADMEQVPSVSGRADQARITASTGGSAGGTSATSAADGNPTTPADEYGSASLSPTSGSVIVVPGTSTTLTLANGAGATGSSVSATAPAFTVVDPCPLTSTPFTQQTDGWPCGASMSRSNAALTGTLTMTSLSPHSLGTATLATAGAPAVGTNSVSTMVDRIDPPDTEEAMRSTVERAFGQVSLFALPSALSSGFPAGWTGANAYNGYLLTLLSYSDRSTAAAGPTTGAPSAAVVGTPTLWYWNGTGYSSVSGASFNTAGSVTVPTVRMGPVQLGTGGTRRWFCVDIVPSGAVSRGGASAASSGTPRTSSTAQTGSPLSGSIRYTVTTYSSNPGSCPVTPTGTVNVDLTVAFDLGTALARSTYTAPPTGG